MIRRLAAVLVALAVVVAPGAFEACQILCASNTMQVHTGDGQPMPHHVTARPGCHEHCGTEPAMSGSGPCSHGGSLAILSAATNRSDVMTSVSIHAYASDIAAVGRRFLVDRDGIPAVDRLHLHLSVPLRL